MVSPISLKVFVIKLIFSVPDLSCEILKRGMKLKSLVNHQILDITNRTSTWTFSEQSFT